MVLYSAWPQGANIFGAQKIYFNFQLTRDKRDLLPGDNWLHTSLEVRFQPQCPAEWWIQLVFEEQISGQCRSREVLSWAHAEYIVWVFINLLPKLTKLGTVSFPNGHTRSCLFINPSRKIDTCGSVAFVSTSCPALQSSSLRLAWSSRVLWSGFHLHWLRKIMKKDLPNWECQSVKFEFHSLEKPLLGPPEPPSSETSSVL